MYTRRNLLFLCHWLPYPPDSGVTIRSFHILRSLARAFNVTALCFARRNQDAVPGPDLAQRLAALRSLAEVEAFGVPQEHSVWRLTWNHLCSVILDRVYTAFAYDSSRLSARIVDLLRTRHFDLVHMDSIVFARYLPLLGDLPVVCGHHNIESVLLRRRGQAERTPWQRAYMRHQARLMEREERSTCARCRLNVVVSDADQNELRRISAGAKSAVIPNGVDIEAFQPGLGRDEGLVYVGGLDWLPNRDALEYFCEEILPRLRATGAGTPVRWVGSASDDVRRQYRDRHRVELTGYVTDVRDYLRDAACCIVPLRVGGGTRLKILDAWAMGKAVVSTSIGCEGLAAEDGRNILIRDDPESFAHAVRAVLQDQPLRRRLGAEGRDTVERRYSWKRIGESLLDLYSSLDRRHSTEPVVPRPHSELTDPIF